MIQLPQSKVIFVEDIAKDIHQYFNEQGEELLGVTSLMKKHGLSADYEGIPMRILKKAAERGHTIHSDCEVGCEFDDYQTKEGRSYGDLLKEKGITIVATEYLVSDNEKYATMIDVVFMYQDKLYIGDIKSTKALHTKPLKWQLTIGQSLFQQQTKVKVEGRVAFWFNKDKCEFIEIEQVDAKELHKLYDCDAKGLIYTPEVVTTNLPEKAEQALKQIADIEAFLIQAENEVKRLKEQRETYTAIIEEVFASSNLKSWETENLKITLVSPTVVKTFDSKKFAELHPETAKHFIKESEKKGYVKITLKKTL